MDKKNKILGSPNKIIWSYFEGLRKASYRASLVSDDRDIKQETAVAVFLSVNVIEAFVNIYFRVLVSQKEYHKYQDEIVSDLNKHVALGKKLNKWPNLIFRKSISKETLLSFDRLKKLRNELTHFKSSHETLEYQEIAITGLVDVTSFENLTKADAEISLCVAEKILEAIFQINGLSDDEIPHAMHLWTGKPPS